MGRLTSTIPTIMITYLLIILFCTILHWVISIQLISTTTIGYALLGLFPSMIVGIMVDRFLASRHPLWQKIQSTIQTWEREHGKPLSSLNLIVNLSTDDFQHLPEHQIQQRLSMRFGACQLKGYISQSANLYICLSHPENHIPEMISLWKQIQRTQIKFQYLFLCLNPAQLPNLDERLKNEWRFFASIMRNTKSNHLLINEPKLAQAFFNINEFGKLPPAITLNNYRIPKITKLLHQLSIQIDSLIKTIFSQRHELCIFSPISQEQKVGIFQLSQSLAALKPKVLLAAIDFTSHQIQLSSINFILDDPSCKKTLPTFKGMSLSPSKLTFPLTLAAILILLLQFAIHKSVSHILTKATTSQLPQYIMQLGHYPSYASLQKHHTAELKNAFIAQQPGHLQPLYQQLLSFKNAPTLFKKWVVSSLSQSHLSPEEVMYFIPQWEQQSQLHNNDLSLSQVAAHIPKEHLKASCDILRPNNPSQCFTTLANIQNYQTNEAQLDKIQETLLPLSQDNPGQAIIQLRYLIQNPQHIGVDAYKRLDAIILDMKSQGQSILIQKAQDIQSIIHLLKSPNGQFLLNQLLKTYTSIQDIQTPSDAHQFLASIYQAKDHPVLQLIEVAKQLPPIQQAWLNNSFSAITQRLAYQTNSYLADQWNHQILPDLDDLLSQYPFDPKSKNEASSRELYDVFGKQQLLDHYFQQYIAPFVQEDDHFLTIKDIPLGIEIPQNILMTMVYTQVLQSAMDIKPDHIHSSWALSLTEAAHPIEKVVLYNGTQKTTLQNRQGVTLHWDSRHPVGFDIQLSSGSTVSIIKDGHWSLLHLMKLFVKQGKHTYQYDDPNHDWHITLDLNPQYAINLISTEFLTEIPHAAWGGFIPDENAASEVM